MSKSFPYKDQIRKLVIVMVSFCLFPTRNIFNLLLSIVLNYSILSKGTI